MGGESLARYFNLSCFGKEASPVKTQGDLAACRRSAWKSLLFHLYLARLWRLKTHTNPPHVQVDRSYMSCKSLRHHKAAALESCCISPVDGVCWGAEFDSSSGAPSDWFPGAAQLPSALCSSCLGHRRVSHMAECSDCTMQTLHVWSLQCKGSIAGVSK